MAVTVSIPTILRTHTGGEKSVEAKGSTVSEVISDLDSRHGGIKDRLVKDGSLHRFVNIYVNDEDVRFAGGLEAPVSDGDAVTILPAVAGGAATSQAAAGGPTILPVVAGGA
jgi:molybdopterin synthase sulfur carrier subunit